MHGTSFEELYIGIKIFAGISDVLVMVISFPILMYHLRKYHRSEYIIHRWGLCAYYLGMIIYMSTMFQTDTYWYDQFTNKYVDGKRRKITHSNIAWTMLGVHHLLIPLLILYFKKDKDVFSCFTKLDDMATISIF